MLPAHRSHARKSGGSRSLTSRGAAPLCALLLTTLLAGCGMLPEDHPLAQLATPASLKSDAALPGKAGAVWPSDGWWKAYGDGQLTRLIEDGLVGAADMRQAEARLAAAAASERGAAGALLPSIGAEGKVDRERQSYRYLIAEQVVPKGWNDAGIGTLAFNWELDFWGKNRAALAAATSSAEAAAAEAAGARLAVSTAIAETYAGLAALHADRDAAVEATKVRSHSVALIRERLANGLENDGALNRALSAEALTHAQLAEVDEAIGLTRNRLAALIGAGPDRAFAISRPRAGGARYLSLPPRIALDLVGRRPDLVAARARADAAAHRIDVAKASFYPNVNIAAMIGRQALGIDVLSDPKATLGSIGPAVSLPIFAGGRLVAAQSGAEAEQTAAVAAYDGALANALREVSDAVVSKRALARRLADTRQAAATAEDAWRVVSNRYKGGLATYMEVLGAEDALIAARRAAAGLGARAFTLDIQLVRALGGGFRAPEKSA